MRSLSCLWGERERVRYVRVPMLIDTVYEVPFVQKHTQQRAQRSAQTPEQTLRRELTRQRHPGHWARVCFSDLNTVDQFSRLYNGTGTGASRATAQQGTFQGGR